MPFRTFPLPRKAAPPPSSSWLPPKRLVLILGALWALQALPAAAQTAEAPAAASTRQYRIPAGPLADVVNQFAGQAGIALTFDANALQGETSRGVQGSFDVDGGLRQALAGSRWQAHRRANGAYVLETAPAADRGAADAGASVTMATVSVTGSADRATTEHSGAYGGSATTIFKGQQSVRETPQPVTIVSRQLLNDRMLPDLHDVLQNVPGVTVDYTDSERVNYYSRGYQIDSLQVDGINMYQSGSTFVQPDTAVLDRIEILRGSAGILRGSGNPSATVNLVRKLPTRDFQASVTGTLGSWDRRRAEADISGSFNDSQTLRGRIVAVTDDKDFFQDARDEHRRVFYGVLQADITDRTTVTASFEHSQLKATGAWGGLPRNFDGSALDLGRSTYLGSDWNHWNRWNEQAMLSVEHAFDNEWQIKATAMNTRFRYFDGGFTQTYISRASKTNPYLFNVVTSDYPNSASDQNAFVLTANGPFEAFGRKHHLTVGAESSYVRTTASSGYASYGPLNNIDIRDWDSYRTYPEPSSYAGGSYYEASNNVVKQQALYALGRFSIADPLTVMLGARGTWYDYEVLQGTAKYRVNHEITPYGGVVYDLNDTFSVYGSYSQIFQPQQAYDSGGNLLDPIRGDDYEAGIKGEFFGGRLNTALSLFQITNKGKAMDDASSPNPCLPNYPTGYCKVDGGKTRSRGWELEVSGELTPDWQIMAGYTNTRTKYLKDSTASNVGLPIRSLDPRHLVRVFTTYRLPGALHGLTLGGGVQAQSSTYATGGGVTAKQGGYAIYNAMAAYDINKHVRVQLNVNNIFDKVYYKKVDATGISNYYGDPRNVMLSVNVRM
ncbi:TonB-dependent siderophore receptor [Achromobacter aloeverae]